MPIRSFLPNLKPILAAFCLFCAFSVMAQRSVDVLFSPVSNLENSSARVSTVNVLADSILLVELEILPTKSLERLPVGVSPQTILVTQDKTFPVLEIFTRLQDSWEPQFNPDGFQGWHNVNAGYAYHAILTFIIPTLSTLETFSILPSDSSDSVSANEASYAYVDTNSASGVASGGKQEYYSFRDIVINPSLETATKAFQTTTIKSTPLYCEPSSKSKKLLTLTEGENICIIEDAVGMEIQPSDRKASNFYRAVVLSSGMNGFVEKKAVSKDRSNLELLNYVVKLSKRGDLLSEIAESENENNTASEVFQKISKDFAQIEFVNTTHSTISIAFNDAQIEIDPLKVSTFRLRVDGPSSDSKAKGKTDDKNKKKQKNKKKTGAGEDVGNRYQYLVLHCQGLPPTIIQCQLKGGDYYFWQYARVFSF